MSIADAKRELGQGGMRERPEKTLIPSREEKKDTSIFGGKPDMEAGAFIYRLKDPKLYSKTSLGEERRVELGKRLFGSYGSRIDQGEIKKAKGELDLGKWGKFKDFSPRDKEDAEKLIRGLSEGQF